MLITAGDSVLRLEDVTRRIPTGLTEADSVAMFNRIVENWVEQRVLAGLAEDNVIDLERIDRLTQEYRNQLIIEEYLRKKTSSEQPDIKPEAIRAYYEAHKEEMRLREPILKGIFLQISDDDPHLQDIRSWLSAGDDASVDKLEKYMMERTVRYEYFNDHWIGWHSIAEKLPERVEDGDEFLRAGRNYEQTKGNTVYLLHVSEWKGSGEVGPLEYVSPRISSVLAETASSKARARLIGSIYTRAIKSGTLVPGLYNPLTGEIRAPHAKKEEQGRKE